MNSEPTNSLQAGDYSDSDSSALKRVEYLIENLIEQDRQSQLKPQPPTPDELAKAIARILPAAIETEIQSNPEAIAKAIAPEIALSIREQIILDESAIPQTLGPEMGKAIKAQIESEKDAMVDALYPVIGSTISKYMVEVVQDINSKIENTLSPDGIKRKFQAKMQGVSEAELIFKESIGYRVRAIFLIAKDSGLIIQELQIAGEQQLDSEMLGGMLTAIRSFANDCIVSGSELDSIDYGDWQIPLEVAGYCYLAVIVAGEPPKEFINKIRRVLGEVVMEYDLEIQNFDGDLTNVPFGIRNKLEQLIEEEKPEPSKSSSPLLLWILIVFLGATLIPLAIGKHRAQVAQRIEQQTAVELDAAPELSVYRLDPEVKEGKLTVTGRVPNESDRDRAEQIVQPIAEQNDLELDNQILTVNVPFNPRIAEGEIRRLTNLFNQQPELEIVTNYESSTLKVEGYALSQSDRQTMIDAFSQIPGVERVIFELTQQLPKIESRIYFDSGATDLGVDDLEKIEAIRDILQRYDQIHLRLIAQGDGIGSAVINQKLSQERCNKIRTALVTRGIESSRLVNSCELQSFTQNKDNHQAVPSERYVSFEPFVPLNLSQ
ncbi:MAG: BON domain-containing protein [Cyanobacteria bacterium J06600_6]